MKSIWREIVMAVIMGMILPGIVLNWAVEEDGTQATHAIGETAPTIPVETQYRSSMAVTLRHQNGTLETMNMDDYLVGVLLGEMPSTFHQEAKKAQSVVARTFARKAFVTGGKHGDGSVCENAACCQAHITVEEYLARGGTRQAVEEAAQAVYATSGYVLTYEGQLIEATYFSCSGGSTEDAVAVWGTDFPYLRAVESPGEEHAAHFSDTVYFTKQEFLDRLGMNLTGDPAGWIGEITYTAGDGIDTMKIGGTAFRGTQLRSLLSLRSTSFAVIPDGGGITIISRGFGHRVGMSQYGADAMGLGGSTYQEILAYYYGGTSLELTNDDS